MNMMRNLISHSPVWAPSDETGTPASEPDTGAAPATPDAPDPATEPAELDYSFLPEEFRQDGSNDIEGFRARFDDMAAQAAQREEAMADVPEDASGYEFALPAELDYGDLELPDDYQGFKLNLDEPTLAPVYEKFGELLHKYNLPNSAASEFLGMLAQYRAAEDAPLYAQSKAEMKSLGSAADSRIANVDRVLTSRLPADQAAALKAAATTANGVKALEALLKPRGMTTPTPTPTGQDDDSLTPFERLKKANNQAMT